MGFVGAGIVHIDPNAFGLGVGFSLTIQYTIANSLFVSFFLHFGRISPQETIRSAIACNVVNGQNVTLC